MGFLLAKAALQAGMIDSIHEFPIIEGRPSNIKGYAKSKSKLNERSTIMNLEQFKSEHGDLYASIVDAGATKERDRVVAHLTLGQGSGDLQTAIEAIKDGSEMTATYQARYMTAGLNNRDIHDRIEDSEATPVVPQQASRAEEKEDFISLLEKRAGLK